MFPTPFVQFQALYFGKNYVLPSYDVINNSYTRDLQANMNK